MENNRNDQKGTPSNPAQSSQPSNNPQDPERQPNQPREGDKRKVLSSNDAEAFDDNYSVNEENKLGELEVNTEDENNTSGSKRGDTFNKEVNG